MLQTIFQTYLQSFLKPRAALREVIDRVDGFDGVLIIVGLASALNAIVIVLAVMLFGAAIDGGALEIALQSLVLGLANFLLSTLVMHGVGKLFGGQATIKDSAVAMAWYMLVSVAFAPFLAVAPPLIDGETAEIGIVHIIIYPLLIWLGVNYIAEAHRFRSAARVAGVMFGLAFAISVLLLLLRN